MSGRRRITLTLSGSIVVAKGWRCGPLVVEAGVNPTHSASAGGWMFDRTRLPDVEAYLQSRNIPVVIVDPDQGELELGGGDAA
jgi:hypothetical protein